MPDRVLQLVDATAAAPPFALVVSGDVSESDIGYARQKVERISGQIGDPVLAVRMKLTMAPDPARDRPAIAQATIDVNGEIIRAHVAGHDTREAADLLEARLRDKVKHRAEHLEGLRSLPARAEPGEWTRTALPTARPEYFDRPVEDRQVVRRKTFSVAEQSPEEAAYELEQLDYDFHLFRDLDSGVDSVIERLAGGGYRLTRLEPSSVATRPVQFALDVSAAAPPTLTTEQAIDRLDATGATFVFFADAATGRGNVVYRRYDGHYGVIAPAD